MSLITSNGALPPEYLELLGRVVVYSGRIEDHLTGCIAHATGATQGFNHNAISALVADLGWNAKMERLQLLASREISFNNEKWQGALNRVVADAHAAAITKLTPQLRHAAGIRNKIVHGKWSRGRKDRDRETSYVVLTKQSNHGKHRTTHEIVEYDQLEDWVRELEYAERAAGFLEMYLGTGDPDHNLKEMFHPSVDFSPPARETEDLSGGVKVVRLVYVEGGSLAMEMGAATEEAAIEKLRRWAITAVHRSPFAYERSVGRREWERLAVAEIPGNQ